MPRVLICDKLESAGVDILTAAGIEVDNRPGLKGAALQEALAAADGAIVRSGTQITAPLLDGSPKLRAVVRAGVGVDNIDVATATRRGVVVMNTPGGNTISAAEHTIALMLSMARHIPTADATMKAGKWERGKLLGTQVAGKTLGVIGLGRIGREVAKRALGLDMKVVGYDPFVTAEKALEWNIEAVASVDLLLPECDYITIHTPLNDQTRSLIGGREIAMLKKGVRLLNVARGGIIDETALAEALHSGKVAGAGIDVFTTEPPPADLPLLKAPNLVLTPHLGASTVEAQEAVAIEGAHLLVDFLTKGIVSCAVNMSAVNRVELEQMRHYVDLARRLGMLQAQIAPGPIKQARLQYRGELTQRNTRLLTAAFAAGMLEYHLAETANVVNAEMLARERGIEIIESSSTGKSDFASQMFTEVVADGGSTIAAGTLFGNQYSRLVQLGPYRMESYLDGHMVFFLHRDVPGIIGYVGNIFAGHNVNIAQMTVGRNTPVPGGEAIASLNLDSAPPAGAIEEMKKHEKISTVNVVRLPGVGQMPAWFG